MTVTETRKSKMNYLIVRVVDKDRKLPTDPVVSESTNWNKTIERLRNLNAGCKAAVAYVRFEVCSAAA